MKIYRDIEQGSEAWLALRKGRPTASGFDAIITSKGDPSKQVTGYTRELIAECFCPDFTEWAGNQMTDRGKLIEDEARQAFAAHTRFKLDRVGFVLSDDGVSGCSPDSLIVDDAGNYIAGLEIKCPAPKTHVGYVLDGELPADYRQQVHGSMVVTGLNEWHFWSYFPGLQPLHVVVKRDDYTERLARALSAFIAQYKAAMAVAIPKLKLPTPAFTAATYEPAE